MRITRWRADRKPTREEIEGVFKDEGMEFVVEDLPAGSEVKDHRHPFDEVRVVVSGAIRYNVAGNEFLLREGDRLDLPSNTRHWTRVEPDEGCVTIYAFRVS
ncbi:MAG: cupin domain-containing protein [Oligoflexia bacterium]|nr:cupin domain-containing protein [Oligoflexia bacterium]